MKIESKWHVLFEGSGSVTGNDWVEEVCYLGQEQWLLSLRDDPAWSMTEVNVEEAEERTSAELASWVQDMDATDGDDCTERSEALLEIAISEGAVLCEQLLREGLDQSAAEDPD